MQVAVAAIRASSGSPTRTTRPTASAYPQLRTFLQAVPKVSWSYSTKAYNEYLPPADRVDTVAWLAEFPNGDYPYLLGSTAWRVCASATRWRPPGRAT